MPLKDLQPAEPKATSPTPVEPPPVAATGHTETVYPPEPVDAAAAAVAETAAALARLREEQALPVSRAPTRYVRVLGDRVGPYDKGAQVEAIAFEYIGPLLPKTADNPNGLGVLEYIDDAEVVPDEVMTPYPAPTHFPSESPPSARIPPAPWANASPADILGVASEKAPR